MKDTGKKSKKNQDLILLKNVHVIFSWLYLQYFFGYETKFFSFQNNSKNLDPSYKTDLDFWDCLGRVELLI